MHFRTAGWLTLCGLLAANAALGVAARQSAPAGPALYTIWPVEQLTKPGALGNYGHYRTSIQLRDASSAPEVHTDFAHLLMFTGGEGTFVLGGQIADGADGKKTVKGGETVRIAKGAIYHVPANTVHWAVPAPGSAITYWVANINAPTAKP